MRPVQRFAQVVAVGTAVTTLWVSVALAQELPVAPLLIEPQPVTQEKNNTVSPGVEQFAISSSEIAEVQKEYKELSELPVPEKVQVKKRAMISGWFVDFWYWLHQEPPIKKGSKKQELREQWSDMLGTDVFYLYLKADEAREAVRNKYSYRFMGMKMSPNYKDGKVWLIFKKKF